MFGTYPYGDQVASLKKHLLIDARPLNGGKTGITRYVEEFVSIWPKETNFQTTLISNKPIQSSLLLPAHINYIYDDHWSSLLPGTLWLNLRIPKISRQVKATHFLGTQYALPIWGGQHLIKSVFIHDIAFHLFPSSLKFWPRIFLRFIVNKSIQKADRILCISHSVLNDLEFYTGHSLPNARVCYLGRSSQLMPATLRPKSSEKIRLLLVGSIEPRKNIQQMLKIFLHMYHTNREIELDIVHGDSWGKVIDSDLKKEIDKTPSIQFHHKISDALLKELYSSANFLIMPSLYEGFGIPVIEAIGHCSVIANDIPVFRELSEHISGMHLLNFEGSPEKKAEEFLQLLRSVNIHEIADDKGYFTYTKFIKSLCDSMNLT